MSSSSNPCSPDERFNELVALYHAWGGESWTALARNWDWRNRDGASPCSWTGVECTDQGHVRKIQLGKSNLNGTLSSGFIVNGGSASNRTKPCLWDSLQVLDLNGNKLLRGQLPAEWRGMTSLLYLNLEGTSGSGNLPVEWSELKSIKSLNLYELGGLNSTLPESWMSLNTLEALFLGNNPGLHGVLPEAWGQMARMQKLHLEHCSGLTGPLPETWGQMARMQELHLEHCSGLTGPLPSIWSSWNASLEYLYLHGIPGLTGSLPPSWSSMGKLIRLRLDGPNGLTGSLPEEWGNMKNLEYLVLFDNKGITGTLPKEWGKLSSMLYLGLSNMSLSGPLPSEWGNMSHMAYLYLSDNDFVGQLPAAWSRMDLVELRLQNNRLQGTLPPSWSSQVNLEVLYLSNNTRLGGILPPSWSAMEVIHDLRLAHCSFRGNVPKEWFSNMTELKVLTLNDNFLSGTLPAVPPSLLRNYTYRVQLSQEERVFKPALFSCAMPNPSTCTSNQTMSCFADNALSVVALAIPGNAFSWPLAAWSNAYARNATIFYNAQKSYFGQSLDASSWELIYICSGCIFGVLLLISLLRHARAMLKFSGSNDGNRFDVFGEPSVSPEEESTKIMLWGCIELSLERAEKDPVHQNLLAAHAESVQLLGIMTLPALLIYLPSYMGGKYLYECMRYVPQTSAAFSESFGGVPVITTGFWIAGVAYWVIQRSRASWAKEEASRDAEREKDSDDPSIWTRLLYGAMFANLVLFLSLPGGIYALTSSIPPQNTLLPGTFWPSIFKNGSSVLIAIVNAILVPIAVGVCHRGAGLDPRGLAGVAKAFTTWLFACIFFVILSNDCFGYWMLFWTPCVPVGNETRSTAFDVAVPPQRLMGDERLGADLSLMTEDVCRPRYRNSRLCARSVVEMLGPLLLNKLVVEGFFIPVFKLLVLWQGQDLIRSLSGRRQTDGEEDVANVQGEQPVLPFLSFLTNVVETAIIVGPLVPLLIPFSALACAVSLLTFHIGSCGRRFVMAGGKVTLGPNWLLVASSVLGQGLALFLAYDNDEAYYDAVFLLVIIGLTLGFMIFARASVSNENQERDRNGDGGDTFSSEIVLSNPPIVGLGAL